MTESRQALRALRAAHGEFVAAILATRHRHGAALICQQLVCNTQAAQHLHISDDPTQADRVTLALSDLGHLLAELAASCALVGNALRTMPTLEQQAAGLIESLIGNYQRQTATLRGGDDT